ncbi:MAG: ABC transporter ATP-binding protein [Acetobacteraceae bacterium]
MPDALVLEGIHHGYGEAEVLHGVSLTAAGGAITCLLGPSGCGKSTLLRLAAGLEAPAAGTIRIEGELVAGEGVAVPPERRGVGLLFQDAALFPHLTVADNIGFGLRGQPAAERARRIEALLGLARLGSLRDSYPHLLSGGEQQRVALARALAPQPRVLLLDEPFSGLDTQLRHGVRGEMVAILRTVRTAVVLVTHDPEEALLLADHIALMRAGRIVQSGTPAALYRQPADPFVAAFFGGVNRIEARVCGASVPSPLGPLSAQGIASGTPVACLIREEAMTLHAGPVNGEAGPHAIVQSARLLGGASLVDLLTHPSRGVPRHLQARVPGFGVPPPGAEVWIEVDPRLVHVFPATA